MSAPQIPPAGPQVRILIQQALAYLSRNNIPPAEALLNRALAMHSDNCDALYLFGQMRRVQNRFTEAEQFYRRALAADPARSDIHYHLGRLQLLDGRLGDAIGSLREAIRLRPDFALAHFELGKVLSNKANWLGAEAACREALRLEPGLLPAKLTLSSVLISQNRAKDAEAIIRGALAQACNDPRLLIALKYNLAIALSGQHRHREALVLFKELELIAPGLPGADYNRANVLQSLDRHDDAEAAYRKAIRVNPLDLKAHRSLSQLLYRMDRGDFLSGFDEAMKVHKDNAPLLAEKAHLLLLAGRLEDALETYSRAVAAAPNDAWARNGLAMALGNLGLFEEASREFEHLLRVLPDDAELQCNFAQCLSQAGDAPRALALAQAAARRDPGNQLAIALQATALRQMGEAQNAAFDDCENLVQEFELEPPAGFSDMESFNRELEAYLITLHRDRRGPIDQPTHQGTKTFGTLFGAGHKLVDLLETRFAEAIAIYISRMKDDETHPLFRRRGGGFRYWGSWSLRLADCGFLANHIHPRGWISSAYYVGLPDAVADEEAKQGWLKFGEPFYDAGLENPVRRLIRPVTGRLVLFPSYMWHGTVPFHSQQTRTVISFDAIPSTATRQ